MSDVPDWRLVQRETIKGVREWKTYSLTPEQARSNLRELTGPRREGERKMSAENGPSMQPRLFAHDSSKPRPEGCDCLTREQSQQPSSAVLLPVESMALTVALAQVKRGEVAHQNVATVCIWALARLAGKHDWTTDEEGPQL